MPSRLRLVFDVSDLVQYFAHSRLPTGIQRVQIEVVRALLAGAPADAAIGIVCFVPALKGWAELPQDRFLALAWLAMQHGDADASDWREAVAELHRALEEAGLHAFAAGSWLVNLGSSWSIPNYFLHVRDAKVRYGIRYLPYVHDCIPLTAPEYCAPGQIREFIDWMLGLFEHADRIVVNSHASARDLRRVAAALGRPLPDAPVVTLDADFRTAPDRASPESLREDLESGNFVLMVSTIEARKNHLAVFSAWLALLRRHGLARVPTLVCVGKSGWESGPIHARLASSELLRRRAMILSGVTDQELSALYRHCRFTLYPSFYEGWGLPVTESLCHGRVPLVARSSSLPEAGGAFARYFEPGSQASLLEALEALIFDEAQRCSLEARIAAGFRPRRWSDIAGDIIALVRGWSQEGPPEAPWRAELAARGFWPHAMPLGIWLGLQENSETELWPGRPGAEALRQGVNWWAPETWGSWVRGRIGRLAALAALPSQDSTILHLGLLGLPGSECRATVTLQGVGRQEVSIGPSAHAWVTFEITPEQAARLRMPNGQALLDLRVASDREMSFAEVTDGADRRVAGLGVRGMMLCAASDTRTRLRFLECATLGNFQEMRGRPADLDERGFGSWADAVLPEPAKTRLA